VYERLTSCVQVLKFVLREALEQGLVEINFSDNVKNYRRPLKSSRIGLGRNERSNNCMRRTLSAYSSGWRFKFFSTQASGQLTFARWFASITATARFLSCNTK